MSQKVLLLDKIGPQARPILEKAGFEVTETGFGLGKDPQAVGKFFTDTCQNDHFAAVCLRSGTDLKGKNLEILRQKGVELIVRFGAGTDNIDNDAACASGILIENTPGQNSTSVAEKTMLCALALCHRVGLALKNQGAVLALEKMICLVQNDISDTADRQKIEKMIREQIAGYSLKKVDYLGTELYGKTIGVIGCAGAIGTKVCGRALSWHMKVLGYDPGSTREIEGVTRVSLEEIFAAGDFITVHVPLNNITRNLINRERLAVCRKQPYLLNLSRDGIVDVDAAWEALIGPDPKISGFASDVDKKNHPIFSLPNTLWLDHLGANTAESDERCAIMGAKQVVDWLKEGKHQNGVNFPDLEISENDKPLAIFHLDQIGMIKKISGYFSAQDNNIDTFHTVPGQPGYACTLVGLKINICPDTASELEKLDGVIRVIGRSA